MAASRDDARPRPGDAPGGAGMQVPNFEITGELGSGIRGTVYMASDGKRKVAVKVLRRGISADLKTLARFSQQAENRVRHPNLIPIEFAGELSNGSIYYVMPLLRGDSLERLLADLKRGATDHPSLSAFAVGQGGEVHPQLPRRAAELFAEAADGLAVAHRGGIVHRRLSPRNLILTPAGRLVITDFGGDASTEGGESLAYRAPEQLDPFPEAAGPPADVYALGVILYEALTRRVPFEAESPRDLKEKIQKGEFLRPRALSPEIPVTLEACLLKAMALEPEDRYADADDFAADLRRFLRDETPLAAATNKPERKPLLSRAALLRAAAALVLVAVLGASWWAGKRFFGEKAAGENVNAGSPARGVVSLDPGRGNGPGADLVPRAESVRTHAIEGPRAAPTEPDILSGDFAGQSAAVQAAALTRLEAEISSGSRPREDALLAARGLHGPNAQVEQRALETMALAGRSGPILRLLSVGEGEPIVTLGGRTFLSLSGVLRRILDDDAARVLCAWDLPSVEALDQAPRPALARLDPNLKLALDAEFPREITTEWIRARAILDPASLLDAAPRLLEREELARPLIAGLEAAAVESPTAAPAARAMIARAAREKCLTAGTAALSSLARLGAHAEILDLARSGLPAEFRARALRALGEGFTGLYLGELRAFALTSPEPGLRKAAFEALSAFDEPDAILTIPGAAHDEELKDAAIAWLRRLPADSAAPVLLELLSHPDLEVRALAAQRLGESRRTDLLLPLTKRLLEPRADARAAAMQVLSQRGELTRIPGALAVIFGGPRTSLFEESNVFLDNLSAAVRRFSASLLRTTQDARAALARWLERSGLSPFASTLLREPVGR